MTKIFIRDNTTRSTVYLQYNQGSYSNIRIYLGKTRVQIVTSTQYDVSYEEMLDLHQKIGRLSPNCRGVSLIC